MEASLPKHAETQKLQLIRLETSHLVSNCEETPGARSAHF